MYNEEIYDAISRLADAFSKPSRGSCEVIFSDVQSGLDFAIVQIQPDGWCNFQCAPPIFFALLSKRYDEPATFELLSATGKPSAVRTGIRRIDDICATLAADAESATQQWADEGLKAVLQDDDINF